MLDLSEFDPDDFDPADVPAQEPLEADSEPVDPAELDEVALRTVHNPLIEGTEGAPA